MIELGTMKMYNPDDICKAFHIGKAKCLKIFADREFGAIKLGKKYLVSEDNLRKFISSGRKMWLNKKEDLN